MPQCHKRLFKAALADHAKLRMLFAPLIAISLAGCGADRLATSTIAAPNDYRDNHPVEMAEAPVTLSIFPGKGAMDRETDERIKEFARRYRTEGIGQIEMLYPAGAANESTLRMAVPTVRRSLASGGATGNLSVGEYPAKPGDAAQPIKLAFRTLRARVANRCGEWPDDLASSGSLRGWENRPYWNFGCSTQNMLATQTADPRDLVEPRAETPADIEMRRRAIEKVRQGGDPGSQWKTSL